VEELVVYFSRPYPMSTAGKPHKVLFDIRTKIFEYQAIIRVYVPMSNYSAKMSKNYKMPTVKILS
jgi:hypothetical protein